ncbi:MAG: hypothetical protein SFW36_15765 [Leptolyngbyaceae cyanobacterium bins.59]|nr:hypothetical protein [Leptolyngbyaceae cyanobacterium bins.59]
MTQSHLQLDPLDSPHPIPWNWVLANLTPSESYSASGSRYYRTQSLLSPNGHYASYSRIQMQVHPEFLHSRVSSVLFIENLQTGDLQVITAASPLADNPFTATSETEKMVDGKVAILIPIAWSETSDRILAREFESLFGSGIASDYAVIWDRQMNRASTVAPTRIHYTNAVLLGWSQKYPDRVLFRAGMMGEEDWGLWTVDRTGQTNAAPEDRPIVFGQTVNSLWAGPQAHL